MKMNIFFTIFFSTMSILMADPPNWEDDPGAYEFTASMVAVVHDDGIQLDDSDDILGAFDSDGNVRGIATILFAPFGPYAGTNLWDIQIRSNVGGDNISFKYYDASEDAVLDIVEGYEFIINDILGNVSDPWDLNVGGAPPCVDDDSLVAPFTCAKAVRS